MEETTSPNTTPQKGTPQPPGRDYGAGGGPVTHTRAHQEARDAAAREASGKPEAPRKLGNLELFLILLKINAFTFGGGYTIVPIIREEFVQKRGLISDDEMLDIIALAQSAPGAMAISTSFMTGMRVNGVGGAVAAVLGSVTPPLVIISILFFFYAAVSANVYVRAALRGMSGVIAAMLFISTWGLFKAAIKKHKAFAITLMIAAFILSLFKLVPTLYIILGLALVGIVTFTILSAREVSDAK